MIINVVLHFIYLFFITLVFIPRTKVCSYAPLCSCSIITKRPFSETFRDDILKVGLKLCVWGEKLLKKYCDIKNNAKI